jgi:hypothetical protein
MLVLRGKLFLFLLFFLNNGIRPHVVFQGLILALEDKINVNYLKLTAIPSGSRTVCAMILIS